MTTFPALLATGTRVAILADTFDLPATGVIAGHIVYAHPVTGDVNQQGYAIHLDQGFFAPYEDRPVGQRPWIGTIVAHVESVEAVK